MAQQNGDKFSAGRQALGYLYQSRFALLKLLQLSEETSVLIEKDDDLDFVDSDGRKTLASLKHKAIGEQLTDLSTDFWKSIRIWLLRYEHDGLVECYLQFYLFTTNQLSTNSFLSNFLPNVKVETSFLLSQFIKAVEKSKTELVKSIGCNSFWLTRIRQHF